jgi:hypothetical protein
MLIASDGLLRLTMAELVRQHLDADGQSEIAARLMKVTGWRKRVVDRYPGTSSWWQENYVDIIWDDDNHEPQCYEFRGTLAELTEALEQLVEQY